MILTGDNFVLTGTGATAVEAEMSQPSKRFVLPYEPEYTAHRTDSRIGRAGQLHRSVRRRVAGPALVPDGTDDAPALDGSLPGNSSSRAELLPSEHLPPRR